MSRIESGFMTRVYLFWKPIFSRSFFIHTILPNVRLKQPEQIWFTTPDRQERWNIIWNVCKSTKWKEKWRKSTRKFICIIFVIFVLKKLNKQSKYNGVRCRPKCRLESTSRRNVDQKSVQHVLWFYNSLENSQTNKKLHNEKFPLLPQECRSHGTCQQVVKRTQSYCLRVQSNESSSKEAKRRKKSTLNSSQKFMFLWNGLSSLARFSMLYDYCYFMMWRS